MQDQKLSVLAERFLSAWNSQDVERVLACYTDDLVYRDPNTKGELQGADAMRRYLKKLFSQWTMHWSVKEIKPLSGEEGVAVLWRANFQKAGESEVANLDGMELVIFRGDRVARNEIYFDRVGLLAGA